MKVVLFCGGLGMRLREYSETIPKPMVPIGNQPILLYIMRYYAHFGHKEFILCLGYRGDVIKRFFLEHNEAMTNNFVMSDGGRRIELENSSIHDWKITFVDTGIRANIGERLRAVQKYIGEDDIFMATYADGLTDVPLDEYLAFFRQQDKIACLLQVPPSQTFHVLKTDANGLVTEISDVRTAVQMNGGFFIFKKELFEYLREGEDLVAEPFQRLIANRQLVAYRYDGFYGCMDTFKDKQNLEDMLAHGDTPWIVWE
ncbi:MAG: glucose-1-phosphate cytidylyltransferase [Candidatus Zixiibacteriota bacterium]|nr:MAG: glucose-1-phosphate cytidylyltransferase [candidate division Zixibacteria bacterium]